VELWGSDSLPQAPFFCLLGLPITRGGGRIPFPVLTPFLPPCIQGRDTVTTLFRFEKALP